MQSIRQLIQNLKGWITELVEKRKELLAQKAAEEATLLPNLLMKYMEIRKVERKDWTRAGQNRGTSQDLKAVSEALSYLRQKGLSTVEDLSLIHISACTLEWNTGGHFKDVDLRTARAFAWVMEGKQ